MLQKTFRPVGLSAFERFNLPSVCGCCGRTGLKKTVKMSDGSAIVFMGTGCAQTAMGIDPDNFKRVQKRAQDKHERGGAYREFLNVIVPAFVGFEEKQRAMVCYLGNVFQTWRETGKVPVPTLNNARLQIGHLGAIMLGQDVDGNPVTSPFADEDLDTVRTWCAYLRSVSK